MNKLNATMWYANHMQYAYSMPNPVGLFGLFALLKHSSVQSPSLGGTTIS